MNLQIARILLAGVAMMSAATAHAQAVGSIGDSWPTSTRANHSITNPSMPTNGLRLANSTMVIQDEVAPEVLAAPAPPAIDFQQPQPVPMAQGQDPAMGGMYAPNGAGLPGFDPTSMSEGTDTYNYGYGMCSPGNYSACPNVYYAVGEALYFDRVRNTRPIVSTGENLQPLDYEKALRITFGQKFDCADGWEMVYTGPFKWNESMTTTGTNLNSYFQPNTVDISAFNNAVWHYQNYESKFNSFEFSQTCYAWDVLKQSWGFRYINLDDIYTYASVNNQGTPGVYELQANNHLIGLQYGIDVRYPYYRRLIFDISGKFGGYANIANGQATLYNDSLLQFYNQSQDFQLSFECEIGFHVSYKILPRLTATAGWEFWYLYGAGFAWDQEMYYVNPFTGSSMKTDGDAVYHGGTAGLQFVW
jgi:hypothetical protein